MTNQEAQSLDRLMDAALPEMLGAASDWWRAHITGISATNAAETLTVHLRRHGKLAVEEGLRDAKAALDAGMKQIATATFLASFRVHGIEAAKDAAAELKLEVR